MTGRVHKRLVTVLIMLASLVATVAAGLLALNARGVIGDYVVNQLSQNETVRPAAPWFAIHHGARLAPGLVAASRAVRSGEDL